MAWHKCTNITGEMHPKPAAGDEQQAQKESVPQKMSLPVAEGLELDGSSQPKPLCDPITLAHLSLPPTLKTPFIIILPFGPVSHPRNPNVSLKLSCQLYGRMEHHRTLPVLHVHTISSGLLLGVLGNGISSKPTPDGQERSPIATAVAPAQKQL